MEKLLEYLEQNIRLEIEKYIEETKNDKQKNNEIEEIRLRNQRPIVLKTSTRNIVLGHVVSTEEILQTFEKVCEHSIYSYQKQICEGFITIKGGHRVGITGNCATENGKVININYISSLNFRVAREKKECSNNIIKYIIDGGEFVNTLIASKPGCGKTTVLRDLVRKIGTGIEEYKMPPKTCGIVDERGEIASMYKGVPQNDVGILSDVIDNISKSDGMKILIRSMAPEIIACDEIDSKEDIDAITYAVCSGVKGIFTAHGNNMEELLVNNRIKELLEKNIIDTIIFLNDKKRGEIKDVYKLNKENKLYIKINFGSKTNFPEYNIM